MKSLIFGIIFLLISNLSFAQTQKGNLLAGGNFSINLQLVEDAENIFSLNINPNFGKFLSDQVAAGANIGINYFAFNDISSLNFSVVPFVRHYFGKAQQTMFFVDIGAGLQFSRRDNSFGDPNNSDFLFRGGPGISFFLSDDVAIDAQLLYSYIDRENNTLFQTVPPSSLGIFFGFQIFLKGKDLETKE